MKHVFAQRLKTLLIFLIFLTGLQGFSQINTEKFRKYYDKQGFLFNAKTTLSLKAGNTEYTSVKGTGRLDYNGSKFDYFLVGNFEYKNSNKEKIENQGFLHLRGLWDFHKRANWEFFVQRQYDEFIDLNARNLAGTALKYTLFQHVSAKDSSNTFDMNVSVGLMWENEDYELKPENINQHLIRSTNFISFDWLKRKKLNFTGVIYYQPAFKDFSDFRVSAETGMEFALAKRLYFVFSLSYKYNNKPLTDVEVFDLSIENGIRFEIK